MLQKQLFFGGLEIEYAILVQVAGTNEFHAVSAAGINDVIFSIVKEPPLGLYTPGNAMLNNGGRLYGDIGAHPEYATPETTNPRDLALTDMASERILANTGITNPDGHLVTFIFIKNNHDVGTPPTIDFPRGINTYGCHENYLVHRGWQDNYTWALASFAATRIIYAGAGGIIPLDKDEKAYYSGICTYVFSPRAHFLTNVGGISNSTAAGYMIFVKAAARTYANAEKYIRLQLGCGDSNRSPLNTYLKVGTTALVLQALRQGIDYRGWLLKDPVQTMIDVSKSGNPFHPITTNQGETITALEHQKRILASVETTINTSLPWVFEAFGHWRRVLKLMETDDAKLERELDFYIKRRLIQEKMRQRGQMLSDHRIRFLDFSYHHLGPNDIFRKLKLAGRIDDPLGIKEEEIAYFVSNPPENTRAYFRGKVIKKYGGKLEGVRWDSLSWSTPGRVLKKVILNPFGGTKALTDHLLKKNISLPELMTAVQRQQLV